MHRYLIPALLLILLALGCSPKKGDGSTPLAQVNGDILTQEAFRSTFTDEQWNALSAEQKKQELEDWVNITVLAQEADLQKLSEEKAVRQRIDYAQKKIKANALIAKRMANMDVSEDALFAYYRVHQADFQSKLMEYNVQRIFLADQSNAEILLKRLKDGLAFDEAVASYSQETLRDNQGRMGFVTADGADSLFWRAAHGLQQNEPGILNTASGCYILRYTQQREGTQDANFEEYRSEIRTILLRDKQRQVYEDLIRELKAKTANIYYY